MIRKLLTALLTLAILICAMPFAAMAEVVPPTTLSAPEHFAAGHYYGDYVYFTLAAPEELRDYIETRANDDPVNKQNFTAHCQFDYKIDNGSWHYTKDWDSQSATHKNLLYARMINGVSYLTTFERVSMSAVFADDPALKAFADEGWDYLKSHKITFRARFVEPFDNGKTKVISDWSNEYVFSANLKADTDKMINHAPTLITADLKTANNGMPYFDIKSDRMPGAIMDMHGMSGGNMRTEIWMRRLEDKDFKLIKQDWGNLELFKIDADDYFSVKGQSYDSQSYEIKIRYSLDLRKYKQSGVDSSSGVYIYSPFSNVISHNMPAWSNASQWATAELKKADDAGLIPDILKGADLTKPITREEFCELALLLYEKSTGKSPAPASPNHFTDTKNPQVLKAFALGITTGTSDTTFSPQVLINREQCATMLYRALKAIVPRGEFNIAGVKDFPDQKDISSYAVEGTKYMAKLGIIKGDKGGNFMPKAVTSAQKAAGYGAATREAAVLMSVRSFEQIEANTLGTPTGDVGTTPPTDATTPPVQQNTSNDSVVGTWILGNVSGGKFNAATGMYEGGASGLGQIYTFKEDGTYSALVIWSNATYLAGKYSVKDDVITLINRIAQESNDDGSTWGAEEALPDASSYFTAGTDESGRYLVIGTEGAVPPLNPPDNALKYKPVSVTSGIPKNDKGIAGVWLGTYIPYDDIGLSFGLRWRWVTFFEDGTFYFDLPLKGFIGYDRSESKKTHEDFWGTYTFSGGSGIWKYNRETGNGSEMTIADDGGLDTGGYGRFYRCVSVNGLKLNGAYTTYADSTDPDLKKEGIKPVFRFKEDGSFVDEGLYMVLDPLIEDEAQRTPGSGTYEVKDFSLILHYSDGRTKQAGFTLGYKGSIEESPTYIFMHRMQMTKMP